MATTASLLPPFPRIFFLYIEPICITYGIYKTHVQSVLLRSTYPTLPIPTLLLGSATIEHLFTMILFSLVILLSSPPNKRLAQLNIVILVIADLTHWAGLFSTMAQTDPRGFGAVLDVGKWSGDVWELALYPVATLAIKLGTLQGWFGEISG